MKELEAMRTIANVLDDLNEEEIKRVLTWALDKFDLDAEEIYSFEDSRYRVATTNKQNEESSFDTVADLYYKASPSTDAEKALVIGYWFQVLEGDRGFDSYTINNELKHLGHQIGNITRAFSQLMNKKPQLAVQTKKTGNTKQARKKYKLTVAGIKYVEEMMAY